MKMMIFCRKTHFHPFRFPPRKEALKPVATDLNDHAANGTDVPTDEHGSQQTTATDATNKIPTATARFVES